jgi:succinoglycan biosynthesis protein ExoO
MNPGRPDFRISGGVAKVSILIPAWRAELFVGQAIASARAQTLADIKIIVVNDCSPDDTSGAVRRAAAGDPRVTLLEHPVNQGPAAARNTALDAADGAWIAVLDADDAMAPTRLERLVAHGEREGADIVADDLRLVSESLTPIAPDRRHLGLAAAGRIDLADYARGNEMFSRSSQTGYLKPVFRAEFLNRHGLRYDPSVRIGEDYMFVATALALGARYALYADALYDYRVRDGSISARLSGDDLARLIAADDRFQDRFGAGFDPRTRAAVGRRRASLEDAAAFTATVDALKGRRFAAALAAWLRRPASLRHFAMPIGARLERLRTREGRT